MDAIKQLYHQHKGKIGIFLLLAIGAFIFYNFTQHKPEQNLDQQITVKSEPVKSLESVSSEEKPKDMMVDVKGAVKYSGVYPAKKSQRVNDIIKLAVPLKNADIQAINLAAVITDQMVIYVPFKGEVAGNKFDMYHQPAAQSSEQQTVNINTAGESELQNIPGIGPKKAQDILMYREQHGGFKSKEEMKEIKGIGDKTYMTLEPFIEL